VIQYLLRTGRAAILRDEESMVAERGLPQLEVRIDRMAEAVQDPVRRSLEIDRGEEEAAIAEVEETAQRSAASTLSDPPEFVLLVLPLFKAERRGDFLSYKGELARLKGRPMTVHVLVPGGVALPVHAKPVPRIFGRVVERPSGLLPDLTVEAIAVF
jgi:hypothetical protein